MSLRLTVTKHLSVHAVFCLVERSHLTRFVFRTHLTKFVLGSDVMMFCVGCNDANSEPMVVLRWVLGSVSVSVTLPTDYPRFGDWRDASVRSVCKGVVTPPPKFIRSKIFWVNLWQLYYSDSTVFKFCTSMWLFSALVPALYKGCGLLEAIIFFSIKLIWQTPGGPWTRGTNSWLHDTESHKNFAPDFLLKVFMFNMQEIWSFDSQKNY